jgi:hypothetical protein
MGFRIAPSADLALFPWPVVFFLLIEHFTAIPAAAVVFADLFTAIRTGFHFAGSTGSWLQSAGRFCRGLVDGGMSDSLIDRLRRWRRTGQGYGRGF